MNSDELQVRLEEKGLSIFIATADLLSMINNGLIEEYGEYVAITHVKTFMKSVVKHINDGENEDGKTLLDYMIADATTAAVERGDDGCSDV